MKWATRDASDRSASQHRTLFHLLTPVCRKCAAVTHKAPSFLRAPRDLPCEQLLGVGDCPLFNRLRIQQGILHVSPVAPSSFQLGGELAYSAIYTAEPQNGAHCSVRNQQANALETASLRWNTNPLGYDVCRQAARHKHISPKVLPLSGESPDEQSPKSPVLSRRMSSVSAVRAFDAADTKHLDSGYLFRV